MPRVCSAQGPVLSQPMSQFSMAVRESHALPQRQQMLLGGQKREKHLLKGWVLGEPCQTREATTLGHHAPPPASALSERVPMVSSCKFLPGEPWRSRWLLTLSGMVSRT